MDNVSWTERAPKRELNRLRWLLLIVSVFASVMIPATRASAIAGVHHQADIADWPGTVQIVSGGNHICGGTLVGPQWVVTAAHCVFDDSNFGDLVDPGDIRIRAGSVNRGAGTAFDVDFIRKHHDFHGNGLVPLLTKESVDFTTANDDIAMIRLATPVPTSVTTPMPMDFSRLPLVAFVDVAGWGNTNHFGINFDGEPNLAPVLRELNGKVQRPPALEGVCLAAMISGMFCVKSVAGGCGGDSGGPMARDGVLVGVFTIGDCNQHSAGVRLRRHELFIWHTMTTFGPGQNILRCEGIAATLFGTEQPDTVRGTSGSDVIVTLGGADEIDGRGGGDLICAGGGDDDIDGGTGDDRILAGFGHDVVSGGDGDDEIFGDAGFDVIDGGWGDDEIWGDVGDDTIDGGEGRDEIDGGEGKDVLRGGADGDKIWGGPQGDTIYGEWGDDDIWGQHGHDVIEGGRNDDEIWGGAGRDDIRGNAHDDDIWGGDDDDTIDGDGGNDEIFGEGGNDDLFGSRGRDDIDGGPGTDEANGGDGSDTCIAESRTRC